LVGHNILAYDELTARENLAFAATMAGLSASREQIDRALGNVALSPHAEERTRGFSSGMKRRLALALALAKVRGKLSLGKEAEALEAMRQLPSVIHRALQTEGALTDWSAQRAMRSEVAGVGMALMLCTLLHSIAVGNLLPARCKTVCVDINPASVTKLTDRGSLQTIGVVMDCASFLRELALSAHALA